MGIQDFKPKRDEEIRIRILDEGEEADEAPRRRRRSPIGRRSDDYLPRRRQTGAIRFFDMLRPVSDPEIYASFSPTVTRPTASLVLGVPAINTTQAEALMDDVTGPALALDAGDWSSEFERIRKDEIYERAISASYTIDGSPVTGELADLEEWTEAGLALPADAVGDLALTGSFLFDCTIDFADLSDFKVTGEPSFDAPAVAFTPSPTMDIFLFPEIVFWSGLNNYYNGRHVWTDVNGTVSRAIEYYDYLGMVYSVIPRASTEEILDIFATVGFPNYSAIYAFWNLFKTWPASGDARFIRGKKDFYEFSPYDDFVTWFDLPASSFPFPTIYGSGSAPTEDLPNDLDDLYFGANFGYGLGHDRLSLAIRKAGATFYFWRLI